MALWGVGSDPQEDDGKHDVFLRVTFLLKINLPSLDDGFVRGWQWPQEDDGKHDVFLRVTFLLKIKLPSLDDGFVRGWQWPPRTSQEYEG